MRVEPPLRRSKATVGRNTVAHWSAAEPAEVLGRNSSLHGTGRMAVVVGVAAAVRMRQAALRGRVQRMLEAETMVYAKSIWDWSLIPCLMVVIVVANNE